MLAEATALILAQGRDDPAGYIREKAGLYHLAGSGACSRYEWAQAILELDPKKNEQKVRQLLPAKSSQFPTQAERPLVSGLECVKFERVFGLRLTDWRGSLQLAMDKR
jgi:dTDP-4-dehydrorhamnose reductase